MKKYDTIYLDWDGVLWDFKQAFCDALGIEDPNTDKWEFYEALSVTADEFHKSISELPQEFWQQEKYIMPHAHDLVRWAKANADAVFVLTVAPEWDAAQGKQYIARGAFNLGVYTVATSEEKVEFAKKGCLLIDDKSSTVIRFAREVDGVGGGFVWPARYNQGLDTSWYFRKANLHKPESFIEAMANQCGVKLKKSKKAHWALTDEDRAAMLKDMEAEKPKLDYEAMDEAKKRKMTPMYSGLLAYFPDALALVARNSMIGHYQHNDPKDPMYWDRTKSADEMDAMIRHMADHGKDPYDADGTLHMSKVAWRALAFLQKFLEEKQCG